ncbi:MAG: hypothetical protein ACOC7J_00655 [Armatimonadota bacterium]
MAQAIVTVLILLIFVAYAVFFSMWNADPIEITSLVDLSGTPIGAELPVFIVPLAGVVVGAIVMAIAVSAPWSSLKSKLAAAEDQRAAARERAEECERRLDSLKSRLQKMQARTQSRAQAPDEEQPPSISAEEESV